MPVLRYGSTGIWVELLQSTLKKVGYYQGKVDGIFGPQTRSSVYWFQSQYGLVPDGVVGEKTWAKLMPYINGKVGYIVPTDMTYPYKILMMNLEALQAKYPFMKVFYYGASVLGKKIPYIKLGNGKKEVFYSAVIHANEWINAVVFMKWVEDFCEAYAQNREWQGFDLRKLGEETTIYLVPMLNPDGVDLVTGMLSKNLPAYQEAAAIAENYPAIPFPNGWKANIVGVDLNLQFPVDWEKAREIKFAQGFTTPAPRDFVGYGPLTEPESLAVYRFTLEHDFRLILSYHTQGEVIYWRYQNYEPAESEAIGQQFAETSGYRLDNEGNLNSFAGYRDWFIRTYRRPGYTFETGLGVNPLPISQFTKIYEDNKKVLLLGATI